MTTIRPLVERSDAELGFRYDDAARPVTPVRGYYLLARVVAPTRIFIRHLFRAEIGMDAGELVHGCKQPQKCPL